MPMMVELCVLLSSMLWGMMEMSMWKSLGKEGAEERLKRGKLLLQPIEDPTELRPISLPSHDAGTWTVVVRLRLGRSGREPTVQKLVPRYLRERRRLPGIWRHMAEAIRQSAHHIGLLMAATTSPARTSTRGLTISRNVSPATHSRPTGRRRLRSYCARLSNGRGSAVAR